MATIATIVTAGLLLNVVLMLIVTASLRNENYWSRQWRRDWHIVKSNRFSITQRSQFIVQMLAPTSLGTGVRGWDRGRALFGDRERLWSYHFSPLKYDYLTIIVNAFGCQNLPAPADSGKCVRSLGRHRARSSRLCRQFGNISWSAKAGD